MSRAARVDLAVVGGGTAGLVGSRTGALLGARTALIEQARTGGDCLWTGCVPSKALLASAHAAASARGSGHLGVSAAAVQVDFAAVMRHVHGAIRAIAPVDSPETLRAAGVEVLAGKAVLTGPDRLRVGEQEITFGQALLATGAAPDVPDVPGLRSAAPLTSDTVWDLTELPREVVVLGGGSTGCELGQALARLGAQVTVVEAAVRLLPQEDPSATEVLTSALRRDGVAVLTGAPVVAVTGRSGSAGTVRLADGRSAAFQTLVVALGRVPRTSDLGLDVAGVAVDHRGFVLVDEHLRTTSPRIWAAGDLTGHPLLTHVAGVHAGVAASNAVLGTRRRVPKAVPRVTFTDPEVASVGVGPTTGRGSGRRRVTVRHEHVDRAVADARTEGFSTLTLDRRGRVVGATVVGPRAGETIGEATLAVTLGLRARDLVAVMHPYPTHTDGVWNAAIEDLQRSLSGALARRATGTVAAIRRRWLARRPRNQPAPPRVPPL